MKKAFLWLIIILSGFFSFASYANEISYFSNLALKDGLSQVSVLKIHQDSKGYMWFGTRNGLNKYDGSTFTVYKNSLTDSLQLTSNHITAIEEDHKGNLWIGTSNGLNKLELSTDRMKLYSKDKYPAFGNGIRSILLDLENRLWIGTSRGMYQYEETEEKFIKYTIEDRITDDFIAAIKESSTGEIMIVSASSGLLICDKNMKLKQLINKESGILPEDRISDVYEDGKGNLWIGTTYKGLIKYDRKTGEVFHYHEGNCDLTNNSVRCITEYGGGVLFGTFDGLYSVDPETGELSRHSTAALKKGNLSHFSIYSLFVDNANTLWVGTYGGGVNYSHKYHNRFMFHEPTNIFYQMLGLYGAMVCRSPDCLYIATEGGGLLDFNIRKGTYQLYPVETGQEIIYSQNIVKAVTLDDNMIWCGTNNGRIYQFDTKTKKYTLYYKFPKDIVIYSIIKQEDNSLLVGSSDPDYSFCRVNADKTLQKEFMDSEGLVSRFGSLRFIYELDEDVVLLGTRSNGLIRYNLKTKDIRNFNESATDKYRLLNNYVTSIVKTSRNQVWVGTFGGGFCRYEDVEGIVEYVTSKEGLINDEVCGIVEDRQGRLWISTTTGISGYDLVSTEFMNYDQFSGIGIQEFSPHSGALLANGHIGFSGNNGFITFDPDVMGVNDLFPALVLTNLKINNETVVAADNTILNKVLDDTGEIKLKYNENNLSIGYAALDYVFPNQVDYAFRLVGYDDKWNEVGNRREAYYTNINPGKYVFEVKATNNDKIWNEDIKRLAIIVTPPLWKTWYAYTFYILMFLLISGLILYYIMKKQNLERALVFKQMEQKQLEEFHQTKLRMFTNFSHELRTPLTLIISPLEELMKLGDLRSDIKNKLSLIFSNSQRLLLLVNQLMDLRKNQSGKMKLRITQDDICSFVEEIYCAFNQLAVRKQIDFAYDKHDENIFAWFDKNLIEKVIFNLLSNAFKFTPAGGKVNISLKKARYGSLSIKQRELLKEGLEDSRFIILEVTDTGKGIPVEEMQNIFVPFYQIADKMNENTIGTGIGLSLTYSIIQLHQGMIEVENNSPQGASFRIILPISKKVYSREQIAEEEINKVVTEVIPSASAGEEFTMDKRYTILLAEDNDEVRSYVRDCLTPYFDVVEACNGKEAFELALEKYPDLIVSDIMMPDMDGLELCSMIKNDMELGHIPVVLMTAKSMVVHIKEGFNVGADDYIVKPFNIDVLLFRIKNILESREKLRKLFGKKFSPDSLGVELVTGDDRFTQRFFEVIEENISNSELNIDFLSNAVGLSRSNLYRKLKAITELSPTELIRNKRLEVAAGLLLTTDMPVSEISFQVGFGSHAYFTNSFKSVYGCSPTDYARLTQEKEI